MMNYVWAAMMLIAVIFGAASGRMSEVTDAIYSGGSEAINVCITLAGVMAFWGGFMKIAEQAGITKIIGRLCSPFLRLIFPGLDMKGKAAEAISMNVAANLLGLGNAATPLGIEAMKQLQKSNPLKDTASNHMVTFVVLNTASIQIVPTTIAALRAKYSSQTPMDIAPAIWLVSLAALAVGLMVNYPLCRRKDSR